MGGGVRRAVLALVGGLAAAASGCLTSPGGSDAPPDGAPDAEQDAAPSCIAREEFPAFLDSFDTDELIWADSINEDPIDSPVSVLIAASVLEVNLVNMAGHMLWLKTAEFDLSTLRVTVEMVNLPNPAVSGARAWLSILPGNVPPNAVSIMYLQGRLDTPNRSVAYSPGADRWWQMRATETDLLIETSPDGVEWNQLDAVPRPPLLDMAVLEIGAKTDTSEPGAGRLVVDQLNLPPNRCP